MSKHMTTFKKIKSDLWNCTNIATVSARTYQTINFKNRTLCGNMVSETGKCKKKMKREQAMFQ